MPELTLESLAARVAELERKLATQTLPSPKPAWWDAVGMMEDNEFTRSMMAEIEAASEAERQAALRGRTSDPPRQRPRSVKQWKPPH